MNAIIGFIRDELPEPERAKVMALLEFVVEHRPPCNEEKFRHEGHGI
jgi:hypothetical protein